MVIMPLAGTTWNSSSRGAWGLPEVICLGSTLADPFQEMIPQTVGRYGIESMKICPVKIERVEAALANALKEMLPPHTE
jgi:hypothetical protein